MRALTFFGVLLLGACDLANVSDATGKFEYTVAEDGSAQTSDRRTYDSLGDKTFTRNQKYKITAKSEDARRPHLLLISVTQTIGKKVEARDITQTILVKDGNYYLDCQHFYDVKISVSDDDVDDPRCKVQLLGVVRFDSLPKLLPN